MAARLGPGDIVVMVLLFGLTVAKAIWVSWRAKQASDGQGSLTPEAFFLAGRSMPFWAVGLSIFASNIGTEHFVGQSGAAAASGMPVSIYEWSAGLLIFLLGFGLAPVYLGLGLATMPEWFERRFNAQCRLLLAAISLVAYVLTKIAASLFAGAVLCEVVLGVSMWVSAPIILIFTAAYAASGGLSAVMFTDVGQSVIFIIGGFVGMCFAFSQVGGIAGLVSALDSSGLGYFLTTLRPAGGTSHPWTGMMIGQPLASVWYWCVDQTLVQRVFSARGLEHAQGGCVLAGYLKVLPPFLMVFPGMIARCFFEECTRTGGVAFPDWCETNLSDGVEANKAYPLLMVKLFPDGLRGLLVVSMALAMMSSLDSVFNCVSTIFTCDVYVRFFDREASAFRQVWIGRLVTAIAAACGMAWLPMIASNADGMYLATQSVMTHLSPTLVAVFILGLLWPRANGPGAFVGMTAGFAFGVVRFVVTQGATCGEADMASFSCMDFNHMALIIFALSAVMTMAVSLLTDPPKHHQLERMWVDVSSAPASSGALARDPLHERFLLASGVMLLALMLVLCVGFGYSDNPSRGGHTTISGGILSIVCISVLAVAVVAGMGAVTCWKGRREGSSKSNVKGGSGRSLPQSSPAEG